MSDKRKKRNYIIVGLCAILVLMGIGYASFSSQLSIKGSSTIASKFDVRITNIESELHGAENKEEPTYDNTNGMYANFKTKLNKPGDYAIYKITIENQGTIDARIEKINAYYKDNKYITFTLSGLTKGDKINHGESKELDVKVEFNSDVSSLEEDINIDLGVEIDVGQDSDNPLPDDDYYLTYDYSTNGGTSTTAQNGFQNGTVSLVGDATREGYEFVGWNTNKDATEKMDTIDITQNTTVYAIFRKQINVTYQKGEGVSSISKDNDMCYMYNNNPNCEITLPTITPLKGYGVLGWTNNSNTYNENTKQQINQDMTYIATAKGETTIPTITLTPNSNSTYTTGEDIKVKIEDNGSGIKANQTIYYAWSNSNTVEPSFTESVVTTNTDGDETLEVTIPKSSVNSLTGTYYLWIKGGVSDVLGNVTTNIISGEFKFDNKEPELTISTTSTTKSITVVANAVSESGITKYEYSKDNGSSWIAAGTNNNYTFDALTQGQEYNIKVRITNGVGKQKEMVKTETTSTINKPTFVEGGDNPKTVTITYPDGCGSTLICTYQKDSEAEITVTTKTVDVEFTQSGSVVAKVTDGTNTVSSSYTITILSTADQIIENAGLQKDPYECRYFFTGSNPNNYITFNNETAGWRIMSAECDGTIKIFRNEGLNATQPWHSGNPWWTGWPSSNLGNYVNVTYYNTLTNEAKLQIQTHDFNIEMPSNQEGKTLAETVAEEKERVWNGNVGLESISEAVRTNSNKTDCGTFYEHFSSTSGKVDLCKPTNWIFTTNTSTWWTISGSEGVMGSAYALYSYGGYSYSNQRHDVRPALYLKSDITLTGTGSSSDPYVIS